MVKSEITASQLSCVFVFKLLVWKSGGLGADGMDGMECMGGRINEMEPCMHVNRRVTVESVLTTYVADNIRKAIGLELSLPACTSVPIKFDEREEGHTYTGFVVFSRFVLRASSSHSKKVR